MYRIEQHQITQNGDHYYPIGFNYWPRDTAISMWQQYSPEQIEYELELIGNLGVNHLRIFFRWEDIIPEVDLLNTDILEKFAHFHHCASQNNITLTVTLFIGHMSGQDWFPSWFRLSPEEAQITPSQFISLPPKKQEKGWVRDIYTDPLVFKQACIQIETIFPIYQSSSTILAWDISNENQYWMPPKTPQDGYQYMKRMYTKMKRHDPNHLITIGMGKFSEPSGYQSYGELAISHFLDFYAVHSYPVFFLSHASTIFRFLYIFYP